MISPVRPLPFLVLLLVMLLVLLLVAHSSTGVAEFALRSTRCWCCCWCRCCCCCVPLLLWAAGEALAVGWAKAGTRPSSCCDRPCSSTTRPSMRPPTSSQSVGHASCPEAASAGRRGPCRARERPRNAGNGQRRES